MFRASFHVLTRILAITLCTARRICATGVDASKTGRQAMKALQVSPVAGFQYYRGGTL
ncbi:MAG: hypothetical protein IT525_02620 [Nitrosomonas sp.]|nr:hypothetical protein [Nitrosomonas sp.]